MKVYLFPLIMFFLQAGKLFGGEPDYEKLRADLLRGDPREVEAAAAGLAKINSKKVVRDLMELVTDDEFTYWHAKVYEGDLLTLEPCITAMRSLSEIVPDPPVTYRSEESKESEGFLYDLELWQRWWIANRDLYEADDGEIPPPGAGSLRLLDKEESELVEEIFREESKGLVNKLRMKELATLRDGNRIPTWQIYRKHLALAREAALGKRPVREMDNPSSPAPLNSRRGGQPSGGESGGQTEIDSGVPWLLITLGGTALLGIALVLVRSRLAPG